MTKRWDLVARYISGYDPDVVYFVKMNERLEFACSCGGSSFEEDFICRHIEYTKEFVVDEQGTIALGRNPVKPPRKYLDKKKQMLWWVERNVQQFMLD